MPKFTFSAVDSSGNERTGVVEAPDPDAASAQVKSMGLFPTRVSVEGAVAKGRPRRQRQRRVSGASVKSRKPVVIGRIASRKELTVFTRQLATLTQSGLPLMRSLEVLARQEKNPGFKWVIEQLAEGIRSGNTFSEGLQAHPRVFDRLYINMVKAGEAGGVLDVVLERLARFMEKSERIKGRVRAAMVYPSIILAVTVIILSLLMMFVVPKFEGIYADLLKGAALPWLTQQVLAVANGIKNHFLATILLVVGAVVALRLLARTSGGRKAIDWLAFHLPLFGDLSRKAAIARFSRTFGTLLSAGVPILQALQITRDTSGNALLVEAIDYVHDRVKEGEGVAGPLEHTRVFPGMVTSMIDVGEETGELFEMLNRVADAYEEEVDNAVSALTSVIEPVMIVFLAVVVGTIVVALFLPIIEIIQRMQ
ncbi:MAG: type II secretion system F family protein [Verrucomicrobia bacterium]|nr:MAG: type II secretion system F family protein [Verrucomicrobiota bacterium]